FSPEHGVPFAKWSAMRVRGAIIDAYRSQGKLPRRVVDKLRALEAATRLQEAALEDDAARPAATAEDADARIAERLAALATSVALSCASSLHDPDEQADRDAVDAEAALARAQLFAQLRAAVASRPEQERRLIEAHYFEGKRFDETAAELGLSKS